MMRQYSAELGVLGCAKGPSSLCPMSARGAPAAASVSAEGPAMPLDPGARQCQLAARPPGRRSGFGGGAFASGLDPTVALAAGLHLLAQLSRQGEHEVLGGGAGEVHGCATAAWSR